MRQKLPTYDVQLSVYQNLLAAVQSLDCLAFRQIDEDVNNVVFPTQIHGDKVGADREA